MSARLDRKPIPLIPAWHATAFCRGSSNPDDYFATDRDTIEAVTADCRSSCPVCDLCLAWALDIRDRDAILGGSTPTQRRRALTRAAGDITAAARLIVEGHVS